MLIIKYKITVSCFSNIIIFPVHFILYSGKHVAPGWLPQLVKPMWPVVKRDTDDPEFTYKKEASSGTQSWRM